MSSGTLMNTNSLTLPAPLQQALQQARLISSFHAFVAAQEVEPTMKAFASMKQEAEGAEPFAALQRVDHFAVKRLVSTLNAKLGQYTAPLPLAGRRVLVVGAGPGGLRTAIEALVLGADVQVVEKRRAFSRHNVLVLWSSIVDELRSLGLKELFKSYGTASDKLCIRKLQLLLLKVALLLGAKLELGLEFVELVQHGTTEKGSWGGSFRGDAQALAAAEGGPAKKRTFACDHLVGADGEHSAVREAVGFPSTEVCYSNALGITFNLVHGNSLAEIHMKEVSCVRYAFPAFFGRLEAATGVHVENLVFYKGDTHYFVLATRPASLHAAGIIRELHADPKACVQQANIDQDKLRAFARSVATFVGHAPNRPFALTGRGEPDVALFDFTAKRSCDLPCRCLDGGINGRRLHVHLVGDSAIGPFWPLGTGSNRAVLGAFDAVYAMTRFAALGPSATSSEACELVREQEAIYSLLKSSSSGSLRQCSRERPSWRIEPLTRYKELALPTLLSSRSASRSSSASQLSSCRSSDDAAGDAAHGHHEVRDGMQRGHAVCCLAPMAAPRRKASICVDYVEAMQAAAGMAMEVEGVEDKFGAKRRVAAHLITCVATRMVDMKADEEKGSSDDDEATDNFWRRTHVSDFWRRRLEESCRRERVERARLTTKRAIVRELSSHLSDMDLVDP